MNKVKPITPEEACKVKKENIPDAVFTAFNTLIAKNFDSKYSAAVVKQKDVVSEIVKNSDITSEEIFNNGYLDIEGIYRKAGWSVKYDKPGYNESYEPFFEFKKVNQR